MLVNRPFNRMNIIILWKNIKLTQSLQFIGMWKQFVAGRHSNFVTIRQFRIKLQFFEMMDMDEIHATAIKLNHFYRLPSVHFEDFSENIISAYIKDI